jgi:predicted chitinase
VIGASNQARVPTRPGEVSSTLSVIYHCTFLSLYELQFEKLGAAQRTGFTQLLEYINEDLEIWDVGWCAYMLATVKRECDNRWEPIPEYGRGAGHVYGNPDPYTDAQGKKYSNIYYGRGYVQLTWKKNYLTLGQALGLGDDLAKNPDDALDPDIAYDVMSYGMRNGSFSTGNKLSTYIDATTCDYEHARRIINGKDVAELIAGWALNLEMLLRVSCSCSFSDSPARAFAGFGTRLSPGLRR